MFVMLVVKQQNGGVTMGACHHVTMSADERGGNSKILLVQKGMSIIIYIRPTSDAGIDLLNFNFSVHVYSMYFIFQLYVDIQLQT
jgi:hypothetical protein